MKCQSESSDGKGKPFCDAKGAAVKMVSYTLGELPPITEERLQEMIAFSQRPDSEIDTSDIPVITTEQAKYAVRGGRTVRGGYGIAVKTRRKTAWELEDA